MWPLAGGEIVSGGRRCGVAKSGVLSDWYVSYSPRNDNMNAEGRWEDWANLARRILAHPLTQEHAPHLYLPMPEVEAGVQA